MPERMTMHPDAQAILARIAESGEPLMETLPVLEARKSADERVVRATFPRREEVTVEDRLARARDLAIPVRVYRPRSEDAGTLLPIVIYYHGGGMVVGSIETVDAHCRWLCVELQCLVVSVGYRLSPEFKFPAGVDDALAAAVYVQDNAVSLGGDASRIALVGESSGGTLVAVVCHELQRLSRPLPRAQVMIYPALDSSCKWDSFRRFEDGYFFTKKKWQWFLDHYLRTESDASDPRASPIRYERFEGLPPALIITAGLDPLVDSAKAYADKVAAAGVPVEYRCFEAWPHGFFYWAQTDAAREAMALTISMLAKAFRR
jgi:acetyl esterase